ncbi:hypothetical protein TSUD_322320 [Trifolium subterraneum]|uniref:Uncharacterized protein n=1 Tax=Trifolium subterraneum TaxID=3900 RepID=A0A2Z6N527_TRISU|nr:hypothetical protein TSUD_322320 [Trifolium subterraneum]
MNADCFWNWLENFVVSCHNIVSPDCLMIKDVLDRYILLFNLSNPVKWENKNAVEEFASLLDEMNQLRAAMSMRSADQHEQNILKESKDDMSNNSQGAINSGHGKAEGKKNKSKKNKGGKKGKK